jgi:serine/threonine-protein kinase
MDRLLSRGDVIAQKFEIVTEIGGGTMGLVFLAVDRIFERDVAIKVMHPALHAQADAEHVQRFLREARAAGKLRSEHVTRLYEVGTSEDGRPFIVMEYLEGEGLDQELAREKRLPVSRAVDYLLQACVGLAEAHARGIVHRDLKPANLFVHRSLEGHNTLKLLDFGIAKLSFEPLRITYFNQMLGTPLYMSPEQRIAAQDIDQRTDIWSLGVVLYEALTGRVPFAAETPYKLHELVLQATPTAPHEVLNEVPAELSAVVLRCLEKDPAKRFQDVGELAWALAPFAPEDESKKARSVCRLLELEPATSAISTTMPLPRNPVAFLDSPPPSSEAPVAESDAVDFSDQDTLIQAVVNRLESGSKLAFLVGSALTAPYRGGPGVPGSEAMITLVRELYRGKQRDQFDRIVAAARDERYQAAFSRLLVTHGMKEVNRTIRRAVLQARGHEEALEASALAGDREACLALERDLGGWHLSPGARALGELLASLEVTDQTIVLTSNFDPLIEVATQLAGGRPFRTVLHGDGELRPLEDHGCHIVHFHGDWWRSDTLHTPASLSQSRPKLATALSKLLRERTLVVLGYGGWDDVFTRCLAEVVQSGDLTHGEDGMDVLWGFFSSDHRHILRRYAHLFTALEHAITRGRALFYRGVDLHTTLSTVHTTMSSGGEREPRSGRRDERRGVHVSHDAAKTLLSAQDPRSLASDAETLRRTAGEAPPDERETFRLKR